MKKYSIPTLCALLIFFTASGALFCADQTDPGRAALVKGNNAFALSLYSTLKAQKGNLFFSPYSISTALSMTYLGARDTTAAEMARTLHFTLGAQELHPAFGSLIRDLNSRGGKDAYQLIAANRLWGQKGYGFLRDFLDRENQYYGSSLQELDFRNNTEQARLTINSWVEKQTMEKIKELIKKGVLSPDTRLVLTNAIYFKSPWQEAFKEESTKKQPFFKGGKEQVMVDMMNRTAHFGYGITDTMALAEIPYKNYELSMVVLLPKERDGLSRLESTLSEEKLLSLLSQLTGAKLELGLPKFKTTCSFNLKTILEKMGMKTPFDEKLADFSGINGKKSLSISEVIHKAFVDVNEKGTEAAAATAVVMMVRSAAPQKEEVIPFRVDHPFLFLIRDRKTGSILFMGRIENPAE
jgi:serine protease inhibitor